MWEDTPAAALWETVLREAAVRLGVVYTDPSHLEGMALAQLRLTVDVPIIDLRAPYRREVVDANSALDTMWDVLLKRPDHEATHQTTEALMRQLAAAGHTTGAGLRWHSRQGGSDSVILLYAPPMKSEWWTYEEENLFRLDGDRGRDQIARALASQGLGWRAAPHGAEFDPPLTDV
jgi:hypothetical protein